MTHASTSILERNAWNRELPASWGSLIASKSSMEVVHCSSSPLGPCKMEVATGLLQGCQRRHSEDMQGLCPGRSNRVPAALASPFHLLLSHAPLLAMPHQVTISPCHSDDLLSPYIVPFFVPTQAHVLPQGCHLCSYLSQQMHAYNPSRSRRKAAGFKGSWG